MLVINLRSLHATSWLCINFLFCRMESKICKCESDIFKNSFSKFHVATNKGTSSLKIEKVINKRTIMKKFDTLKFCQLPPLHSWQRNSNLRSSYEHDLVFAGRFANNAINLLGNLRWRFAGVDLRV